QDAHLHRVAAGAGIEIHIVKLHEKGLPDEGDLGAGGVIAQHKAERRGGDDLHAGRAGDVAVSGDGVAVDIAGGDGVAADDLQLGIADLGRPEGGGNRPDEDVRLLRQGNECDDLLVATRRGHFELDLAPQAVEDGQVGIDDLDVEPPPSFHIG